MLSLLFRPLTHPSFQVREAHTLTHTIAQKDLHIHVVCRNAAASLSFRKKNYFSKISKIICTDDFDFAGNAVSCNWLKLQFKFREKVFFVSSLSHFFYLCDGLTLSTILHHEKIGESTTTKNEPDLFPHDSYKDIVQPFTINKNPQFWLLNVVVVSVR